jgi:hypothetical protein
MKVRVLIAFLLLASSLYGVPLALAEGETIDTRIGKLIFESGYPSQETVQKLYDEMDFQRASQAYLWGLPAVGLNEWRKAHFEVFKAKNGEMRWSCPWISGYLGLTSWTSVQPGSTRRSPSPKAC